MDWKEALTQVFSEREDIRINRWPLDTRNYRGVGPAVHPWHDAVGPHELTIVRRSSIVSVWLMISWEEKYVRQHWYDSNTTGESCKRLPLSTAELETLKSALWPQSAQMPTLNARRSTCECYDRIRMTIA